MSGEIERLVAFAKGAYFLRRQIEAADSDEPGAAMALREILPCAVQCAWYTASVTHSTWAADRGADTVIKWFLSQEPG